MHDTLQLRIICLQPPPDMWRGEPAHRFGLQDKKGILNDGIKQGDGTRIFGCDVITNIKDNEVDFSGPFVQGSKATAFCISVGHMMRAVGLNGSKFHWPTSLRNKFSPQTYYKQSLAMVRLQPPSNRNMVGKWYEFL